MVDLLVEALDPQTLLGHVAGHRDDPVAGAQLLDQLVDLAPRALANQHVDGPVALQQLLDQMAADEARRARYEVVQVPSTRSLYRAAILRPDGRRPPDPGRGGPRGGRVGSDAQALGGVRRDPRVAGRPGRLGRRRRSPTPASWPACASAATRSRPSARPATRGGWPTASSRTLFPAQPGPALAQGRRQGHRPRGLADRALLERLRPAAGRAGEPDRRGPQGLRVRGLGARLGLPAGGLPPALAGLRPDAVADRRLRGAPVPHLRARAADARGRARPADGRGDGDAGRRPAAAGLADHGLRPPALPPALRRAGRGRPHGDRHGRATTWAGCGWPSPSATSPATPASPRRRARRRRCPSSSASWRASRARCPRARAWSRRSATR